MSQNQLTLGFVVAKAWRKRAELGALRPGKRTDALALEYVQGALAALTASGQEEAAKAFSFFVFMVATRGASYLDELTSKEEVRA